MLRDEDLIGNLYEKDAAEAPYIDHLPSPPRAPACPLTPLTPPYPSLQVPYVDYLPPHEHIFTCKVGDSGRNVSQARRVQPLTSLLHPPSHLTPLTSHLSPLTSHLTPLTSHLSYLSPLTSHFLASSALPSHASQARHFVDDSAGAAQVLASLAALSQQLPPEASPEEGPDHPAADVFPFESALLHMDEIEKLMAGKSAGHTLTLTLTHGG